MAHGLVQLDHTMHFLGEKLKREVICASYIYLNDVDNWSVWQSLY